jgi:hypothetical protein
MIKLEIRNKKITEEDDDENKKFTFTSSQVEKLTKDLNNGVVLKRYKNPWFKGEVGIRRSGLIFGWTDYEIAEFSKCAVDIEYFAENYCHIKRQDGSIGPIDLRDYQRDILQLFKKNRVILCASRQCGKCVDFNTLIGLGDKKERIGIIYYNLLSKIRKLSFLEKLKINLYNILYFSENKFEYANN